MITKNINTFRLYYFFWRFKPLAVLMIVYFSQITQSYSLAMGVFSVFNISYALTKIPSGIISDKIGRKPIITLGSFLLTLAFFILSLAGFYNQKYLLFIFALLWGIGEALIAGTIDALMFETMQELKKTDNFKILYSKSMTYDQLGCAFGALFAMVITYFYPIQYVAYFSTLPALAQLLISFNFIEPKNKIKTTTLSKLNIFVAFRQFIKNKKLRFYTIMDIYFSTLGDISHRFESAYFKLFTSDSIISLARVLKHIFGMIGFISIPFLKKIPNPKIYFASISSNILIRSLAIASNNIFTPFIHMLINFFYATGATAKTDILQHEFLPQYRASAQSIILFIKGLYMALIMYLIGIIADKQGIISAMISLVLLRIIGLLLAYIWHYLKTKKAPSF